MPQNFIGPATDGLIKIFERRALARRRESYGVLLIMFLLLGIAAWVFIHAKEITTNETSQNTQSLIASLERKKALAAAEIRSLTKQCTALLATLGELRPPEQRLSPAKYSIELADETGRLRSREDIINEINNDLTRTGYNYIDYEIRIKANSLPLIRLRVSHDSLNKSPRIAWPKLDLETDLARLAPIVHDFDIADAAMNQIIANARAEEVQGLIGKHDDKSNINLSPAFLVQLNITRFGTISLVAIGLGLLSPLYRFSARLAAFYQARADALRLHQVAYRGVSILRLIAVLTPDFDFGKTKTTIAPLTDLTSILPKKAKDEE